MKTLEVAQLQGTHLPAFNLYGGLQAVHVLTSWGHLRQLAVHGEHALLNRRWPAVQARQAPVELHLVQAGAPGHFTQEPAAFSSIPVTHLAQRVVSVVLHARQPVADTLQLAFFTHLLPTSL